MLKVNRNFTINRSKVSIKKWTVLRVSNPRKPSKHEGSQTFQKSHFCFIYRIYMVVTKKVYLGYRDRKALKEEKV